MVTRTRNDLISKIAEVLTGEALPRRQSENVIDRRGEPKGPKMAMPGRRPKNITLSAKEQAELIDTLHKRQSDQHRRVWGKQ